ncbi:MAG: A/G-specific adenine glycosylase [Planctomycetes bacterium]|nr:A/G-specific adenine glycosylase [Planctomycetota bacterium]
MAKRAQKAGKRAVGPAKSRTGRAPRPGNSKKSGGAATSPGEELDPALAARLVRDLVVWFDRERRALPWRADRNPYRVWISEAMLQQTRVETVIPYYLRFLARFPTVEALAAAEVEDVLALWSGLGYYRRARTLHATARELVELHGGRFPRERERVLELSGIGPYTAGAVLSIAYGLPEALVDGNVARVFARLFVLDGDPASKEFQARTWELARALVAHAKRPGDWNQALMELGALVCTPREPACERCPVRDACGALAARRVHELPRAKARPATLDVALVVLAARSGGALVLEQRPDGGRMAGLWQLPTIELGARGHLAPLDWPDGASVVLAEPVGELAHSITRHRIRATVRRGEVRGRALPPAWRRVAREELAGVALTGLTRKALVAPFFRAVWERG